MLSQQLRSVSVTLSFPQQSKDGAKLINLSVMFSLFFSRPFFNYFAASKRLSNLIRRPFDLYRAGVFDEYLMGLMNQVAQAMDDSVTQEVTNELLKQHATNVVFQVTNHLFKKPGQRFGLDLASFNMQRGREFGLPGYMEFR